MERCCVDINYVLCIMFVVHMLCYHIHGSVNASRFHLVCIKFVVCGKIRDMRQKIHFFPYIVSLLSTYTKPKIYNDMYKHLPKHMCYRQLRKRGNDITLSEKIGNFSTHRVEERGCKVSQLLSKDDQLPNLGWGS